MTVPPLAPQPVMEFSAKPLAVMLASAKFKLRHPFIYCSSYRQSRAYFVIIAKLIH